MGNPRNDTTNGDVQLPAVRIIGGGLAGSEAALQLAARGFRVSLYEMRPEVPSPAHHGGDLAELVCSNSLKSDDPDTAAGLLKRELSLLGSHLLQIARYHAVPAGAALAVDRVAFARDVTAAVESEPLITVIREECTELEASGIPTIVAAGPLASPALADALATLIGSDYLSFYDAAAPIVEADTLDTTRVFAASRYGKGDGNDYLNIALDEDEYRTLHDFLIHAERVTARDFERRELFAACQPIEEVARTGFDALRYGALKPVGVDDPRTGRWPYALIQLRAENRGRTLYNLVGFQTNLTFPEQRRMLSLIPGLQTAEIARYGVMHRNSFVDGPRVLQPDLSLQAAGTIRIAGQLSGTEGYCEAIATGLVTALNTVAQLRGTAPFILPDTTALGSLLRYATDPDTTDYQPMHVNFGLIAPLTPRVRNKRERYHTYSQRAQADLTALIAGRPDLFSLPAESAA
ncbi:MAG: methylenetetrahydrofolate--tRNA-(uracil(54)-C(5))-methyltransferase (FADH(2)-oxidizing) TrmFO [Actinomycetes bacterium]|jgi:methylenetetrahydrofolate--tRNA-(uracil-5-)-methyltransferase|nr:methylenetetrahydrofolate--tRNA-(uracil(54)-C(5))-methyltransferase (FADH(2)-oxidizing) TrmFO [Actinomycetes bacterium]